MGNADSRNARKVRRAIRQNDAATLRRLVQQKIDLDLAINQYSRNTPLILAACYASVDVIPIIIKACNNKDATNTEGHTALDKGIIFYSLANEYHPHKTKELLKRRRVVQLLVDGGVGRVRQGELELWIRVNKSDPVFLHTMTHLFCRSSSTTLKSIGFAVMLRVNADVTCAACFLEAGATYHNYKMMYLSDLPSIDYKMPVNLAMLILQSTSDSLILQHIENIFISAYPATRTKDEAREQILMLLLQNDHRIRESHREQYPEFDDLVEYHESTVKPLKWLCRTVVRRNAYPNVFFAVHRLALPKKLENYLLLYDTDDAEDPTLTAADNLNMGSNPPSAVVRRRHPDRVDNRRSCPLSHYHPADEIEKRRHRSTGSYPSPPASPVSLTTPLAAVHHWAPKKPRPQSQCSPISSPVLNNSFQSPAKERPKSQYTTSPVGQLSPQAEPRIQHSSLSNTPRNERPKSQYITSPVGQLSPQAEPRIQRSSQSNTPRNERPKSQYTINPVGQLSPQAEPRIQRSSQSNTPRNERPKSQYTTSTVTQLSPQVGPRLQGSSQPKAPYFQPRMPDLGLPSPKQTAPKQGRPVSAYSPKPNNMPDLGLPSPKHVSCQSRPVSQYAAKPEQLSQSSPKQPKPISPYVSRQASQARATHGPRLAQNTPLPPIPSTVGPVQPVKSQSLTRAPVQRHHPPENVNAQAIKAVEPPPLPKASPKAFPTRSSSSQVSRVLPNRQQQTKQIIPVNLEEQGKSTRRDPPQSPKDLQPPCSVEIQNIAVPRTPVVSNVSNVQQPVLSTFAPPQTSPRRGQRSPKKHRPHSHFVPASEVRNIFPPLVASPVLHTADETDEGREALLEDTKLTNLDRRPKSYHAPESFDPEFASHLELALMKRRSQPPGQFMPTKEVLIDFGNWSPKHYYSHSAGSTLTRQEVLLRPGSASLPRQDSSRRRSRRVSPPSSPFNLVVNPRFIVAGDSQPQPLNNLNKSDSKRQVDSEDEYAEILSTTSDSSSDSEEDNENTVPENEGYTRF